MNPCKYLSCFFSSRSPHLSPHFSHTSPALLRQHATSPLPQNLCTSCSCKRKALSYVCMQLPPSSDTESPLRGATPDHPTCIGSQSLWPSRPLLVNLIISLHTLSRFSQGVLHSSPGSHAKLELHQTRSLSLQFHSLNPQGLNHAQHISSHQLYLLNKTAKGQAGDGASRCKAGPPPRKSPC